MVEAYRPIDQNGEPIHAHGGQINQHEGWYYWIGEDRRGRNKVSCYRWGGSKGYFESSYVRLPIVFDSDTEIHICK